MVLVDAGRRDARVERWRQPGQPVYAWLVTEPARLPDDLDIAAAAFWLDTDLESMLATVKPYEGPGEFAIDDLTDDEWDRFVAALSE